MIDIVSKRYWFFLISGIAIVLSLVFLGVFGLKPGIEFSSGSSWTVNFTTPVDSGELKAELSSLGFGNAVVQTTGGGDYLIRTEQLTVAQKDALKADLTAKFGTVTERSFENIDPIIARQTSRTAVIAVIIASIGILLYIIWAFRRLPKARHYGTSAIIALLHDVVITLGIFAILGALIGWEVNLMFITGILAVIGYSINNTVVVYDRVRENMTKGISPNFEVTVNRSVVETISRCLNTTVTTLITILALLFFVGGSIQNFVWVLLIGCIVGVFDSIFITPSLLVVWEQNEWGRFLRWPSTVAIAAKK